MSEAFYASLGRDFLGRCFKAKNGELGISLNDTAIFFSACAERGVVIVGWEMWIVDHKCSFEGDPEYAEGHWCGLIPLKDNAHPGVIGGETSTSDSEESIGITLKQLETAQRHKVIEKFQPFVRFNFLLN